MMPTFSERKELTKQFADDVARMQSCLYIAGKHVTDDDIVYAWADYSDRARATWLTLPQDDAILLKILLEHLPSSPLVWHVTPDDAGDGSGDQILTLPAALVDQLGWTEGDTLSIGKYEDKELVVRRVD